MSKFLHICFAILMTISSVCSAQVSEDGNLRERERKCRLSVGAEWGYTASLFKIYHYNYLSPEGVRIDESGCDFDFNSNGQVFMNLTLDFARKYGLGLYIGYIGVEQDRRLASMTLRGTYYWKGYMDDGFFSLLDGGLAMGDNGKLTLIGKIGGGYRKKLSKRFCLDFLLSFHLCDDHPKIFDLNEKLVADEDLRRHDATYGGVNFTLALGF